MIIKDSVYGEEEIKDKVIIELIESRPMQRLKNVNQAGPSKLILDKPVTRFDHSVGVMILLKRLGAEIDEQIAGLLHDVSHTAFSHAIDFVFPNKNHDFHELFKEKVIKESEIPSILARYGFDIEYLLDDKNFSLLEKNLPDLCADRLDYTFRDLMNHFNDPESRARIISHIDNLIVKENEIIVKGLENASMLVEDYLKMDETAWARPLEVAIFKIFGDAIRIAYDKGIINENDLFMDDEYILKKLEESDVEEILRLIGMIRNNFSIKLDENDYDFFTQTKLRYIDPKYLDESGELKRVSESSEKISKIIETHNNKIKKGYHVKIIN